MTFVDSISEIFGPLLKGLPLVIIPKAVTQNVEMFVAALETMKITRLFAVTSLIRNLLTFLEMQRKKKLCKKENGKIRDTGSGNASDNSSTAPLSRVSCYLYNNTIILNDRITRWNNILLYILFLFFRFINGNVLQSR